MELRTEVIHKKHFGLSGKNSNWVYVFGQAVCYNKSNEKVEQP